MDDKIRRKIAETAANENDWKIDDVRVDEVEELRRPLCSFYIAANSARPLPYLANYAVIGEQVFGSGDVKAVSKILDNCSTGASAGWWAEIVARFHPDLGGGQVLLDESTRQDITRKLNQAGRVFTAPTLDRKKQSVSFLLLNRETYVVYQVEAVRKGGGDIAITKTKVLAP